jgi:glucose-6-phosphate isomerase
MPGRAELPAWRALAAHHAGIRDTHLRDLFADDPDRAERLRLEAAGVVADFAKHRVTETTVDLLVDLAEACGLAERIDAMFRGERVNPSEDRPALHVALRMPRDRSLVVDGVDVVAQVHEVLDRMAGFSDRVRSGEWTGHTGLPIRNVVNIGIGGSDLGPRMALGALRHVSRREMRFRFVSNVDPTDLAEALRDLDPAETLLIVSSKTFTTVETMSNARAAREWLIGALGDPAAVARHAVAITTNIEAARDFGIESENTFGFWDWVGGRYSMDSAIGLSTMLAIGPERFREMLAGFHAMDEHVRTTPFDRNIPVLAGLLAVWYRNFFGAQTMGVMPYASALERFPAYLQQLEMESNGKHVTLDGSPVASETGAVVWGAPGTDAQHSFFQLLHQGTTVVPVDLIGFANAPDVADERHDLLMASLFAQAEALAFGKSAEELRAEGVPEPSIPHRVCEGNRPSTTILADRIDPFTLGALVSLYEHRVFTQAAIWDIDPFDQWGVELGKRLAGRIVGELTATDEPDLSHDGSTNSLIRHYRRMHVRPGSD